MKHPIYLSFIVLVMFVVGQNALKAAILYVDSNSFTGGSGFSWDDAYENLQDALFYSNSGDEIWVAAGEYFPDYGDAVFEGDRYESITLKSGVSLYGGFDGTETTRDQRNVSVNISKISGKIGTQTDGSEDSIHVVVGSYVDATAVLDGFTIEGGSADSGADVYSQGGGLYIIDGSPTISNVTFSDNQGYTGGAVYIEGVNSQPVFLECTFTGNAAFYDGGAVYCDGSSPMFTQCEFSLNYALDGQGGGTFITGAGIMALHQCSFSNNEAVYGGGGATVHSATPLFNNCTFSANVASNGLGGGLEIDEASPTIQECSFAGNSSNFGGGGLSIWSGNPQIQESSFSQNQDSGTYGGGGVFTYLSSAVFTNCEFEGNFANYGAGAYLIQQAPTFENCTFTSNAQSDETKSGGGAGIFNYDAATTISGCTFSWNSAEVGGAVYNYFSDLAASNPKILNSIFTRNFTLNSGQGGAMANWNVHPSIFNSSFTFNSAAFGGAIWNKSTSVGGILVNSLFAENSATDSGGAIYCPPDSYHCTFAGNTANAGSAIFDVSGKVLRNCILFGNTASSEGNPISGDILNVNYCLVEGGYVGTGNLDTDPMFADPTSGDYTLSPSSPAINVGDVAVVPADLLDLDEDTDVTETVPLDLMGNPRIYENGVDMGAYEFYIQDDDQDQLPDSWESTYGLNTSVNDAEEDPDGDGFTNLAEYLLGNNPLDGSDRFYANEAVNLGGGSFEISWNSKTGKEYSIQTSNNLTNWTNIGGTYIATGATTIATINIDPNADSAFFRVVLVID